MAADNIGFYTDTQVIDMPVRDVQFFGAFDVNTHKLQSWIALINAPSEIHDENKLLLPLVLSML